MIHILKVLAALVLPFFIFNYFNISNSHALALVVSAVVLWFFEIIPLAVTGLLIPVLATSYGVLSLNDSFVVFGNPIIFLFLGSFLLARSMEKHAWDKRMIYFLLSKPLISNSLNKIIYSFYLIAWFLSFWISNTAATAVMIPLAISLSDSLNEYFPNDKEKNHFHMRILLGTAFSASIGGIATPIGSPPNLMAIHFLEQKGIAISFLEWIVRAFPVSFVMLIGLISLLKILYPLSEVNTLNSSERFSRELKKLGKLKTSEIQVALVFSFAVLAWLLPGIFQMFNFSQLATKVSNLLPMYSVAIIAAVILFILPYQDENKKQCFNLTPKDLSQISWSTLLIFAGGLCIGKVLNQSGIASDIGDILFHTTANSLVLFVAFAFIVAILFSELGSNTASAAIIIPIILGSDSLSTLFTSTEVAQVIILVAISASFGFMLPISTPPNAIAYSTGKIPLQQMKKAGVLFDILGFFIILGFFFLSRVTP